MVVLDHLVEELASRDRCSRRGISARSVSPTSPTRPRSTLARRPRCDGLSSTWMIVFPAGRNAWYGKSVPSISSRSQSASACVRAAPAEQPRHPDAVGVVGLEHVLAAEGVARPAPQLLRELEHLGARVAGALAAVDRDLLRAARSARRASSSAVVGGPDDRPVRDDRVLAASRASTSAAQMSPGRMIMPDAALEDRRLQRQLGEAGHLAGRGDRARSSSCSRRRSAPGRSPGSTRVPISVLGMCVAIANTGAPLRWQSYSPLSRCTLPGPDEPSTAVGRPEIWASAPAANAPASSLRTWTNSMSDCVPAQRVDDRVRRVTDDAVDLPDPASTIWSTRISATVCAMRVLLSRFRTPFASIGRYSGCHIASWTASIGSSTWTRARPAAVAALTTSTATVADTSRSCSMSGSRPLAGSVGSARPASARAAAEEHRGGHRRGPADDRRRDRGPGTSVRCWPGRCGRSCRRARPVRTGCRSRPARRRRSTRGGSPASARRAASGWTSAG